MIKTQHLIIRVKSSLLHTRRLLSTAELAVPAAESDVVKTKRKRTKKAELHEEAKMSKELKEYFNYDKKGSILKYFPEKLLGKKNKTPETFYLADKNTAKLIANHITKELPASRPLIEINPGPGLLTDVLRKTNINEIQLYESDNFFIPNLEQLILENSNVSLRCNDFLGMWKLSHQDKIDNGSRLSNLLRDLPRSNWGELPNIRLYACVGSTNFFKHLISSIVLQHSLMSLGRAEMYLVLPPPIYVQLTCSKEAGYLLYRATTILFQIMFEHKFIAKLPRKHFLPWQNDYNFSTTNKLRIVNGIDPEFLYLVKINPRKNLYNLCHPEDLNALTFFVKQNCISRKRCIIPSLERWVPNSGPRLILNAKPSKSTKINKESQENHVADANTFIPHLSTLSQNISKTAYFEDINIFTQFGDLNPSEMLTLFHQFRKWPEYNESPFLESMENNLLKLETGSDINGNVIDIVEEDDAIALPKI